MSDFPCRPSSSAQGGSIGNAVQPRRQRLALDDLAGFADQHQEGCLESILDRGLVAQNASADVQHELGMSPDEQLESSLVAPLHESAEQFAIGQAIVLDDAEELAKGAKNPVPEVIGHESGILE